MISTRATGSTIKQKVAEFTFTLMGQNMTVSGKMTNSTGSARSPGLMVRSIADIM